VILEVAGKSVANLGDIRDAIKTSQTENMNVLVRILSGDAPIKSPSREAAVKHEAKSVRSSLRPAVNLCAGSGSTASRPSRNQRTDVMK
jgi:hypothetical protein